MRRLPAQKFFAFQEPFKVLADLLSLFRAPFGILAVCVLASDPATLLGIVRPGMTP